MIRYTKPNVHKLHGIRTAFAVAIMVLGVSLTGAQDQGSDAGNAAKDGAKPEALLPADDPAVLLLKEHGVKPTAESLRAYLKSMLPDSTSRKAQEKLVSELGHPDYHVRERAMKTILRLPTVHVELLKKAAEGDDPEVRWRAGRLLQTASRRSAEILAAAYSVIRRGKIPGLAAEVYATFPLCNEQYLEHAAGAALRETARKKDAELLKKHLNDKSLTVRLATIKAYGQALGKDAGPELHKLINDPDDNVKVTVARALIQHDDRKALEAFGKLLDSKELEVRVQAVKVLRAVSGKRFKFVAYETPENRATARDAWRKWIAGDGKTVALKLPLREGRYEVGRTLICDYSRHRVIEFDLKWKPTWEHSVGQHPWACQGLPNGHRLVASYSSRSVTEYDAAGKVEWAKTSLPGGPTGVQRLENGNTLIACTDSHKVVEVAPKGDIVWEVTIRQRPTHVQRLDNGRTLICLQNGGRVVEVNRKKEIVWQITGLSSPFSASRLDNGNTLIACSGNGSVLEYDPTGKKIVWQKRGFSSVYDAQRLSNGNTLIGDYRGIREVNRDGKIVWEKHLTGVSKFHRY